MADPIRAISVGDLAQRTLGGVPGAGRILAVFRSTLWIELPAGALCVTLTSVAPGPVNIVTNLTQGDWRSTGLHAGQAVRLRQGRLNIGGLEISAANASIWTAESFCADRLELGLRRLAGYTPHSKDVAQQPWVDTLRRSAQAWCRGVSDRTDWAHMAIGRGSGLTPSGDDFLGGILIGLHLRGRSDQARRLWSDIRCQSASRTNIISFTLLSAAATGQGSSALHRALNGIGRGEAPETYASGVDALGHSSGWDALNGAVVALEAELEPGAA